MFLIRALRILVLFSVAGCAATTAAAQSADVLASARRAVASGHRPDALTTLAAHLSTSPRDVDARLLYGLVLSWEGRYDEARCELQQVLTQSPGYTDARIALMNVEWWSGHKAAARDAADNILARDPGNQQARHVRDRLETSSRPWWAGFSYGHDSFSDNREGWNELALSVTRRTPRGSVILRASEAQRFGYDDRMIEVDFYPRIRRGTYAFVSAGVSPENSLYPAHRVAFDVYQSVGGGFEVSTGFRRLGFESTTNIYVATMSKYLGNWMFTGKVFHVPHAGPLDSTSYHGGFRRYIRGDGESYLGLTYSHGFSREEIRNVADLATLDSDTVRLEVNQHFARRLRVFVTGGTSRQERQTRAPLWQTSLTSGVMVLF